MKYLNLLWAAVVLNACSNMHGKDTVPLENLDPLPAGQIAAAGEQVIASTKKDYKQGEFHYTCAYIPSFVFLKGQDLSDSGLLEAQQEYGQNSSFLLELKVDKFHDEMLKYQISGADDYHRRIEYFSFQAHQDVRLVCDSDTFSCSNHHLERTYGMSPTIRLSLRFPVSEERAAAADNITLEFFDRIYGQGIVNFRIDPAQMKRYRIVNPHTYEEN